MNIDNNSRGFVDFFNHNDLLVNVKNKVSLLKSTISSEWKELTINGLSAYCIKMKNKIDLKSFNLNIAVIGAIGFIVVGFVIYCHKCKWKEWEIVPNLGENSSVNSHTQPLRKTPNLENLFADPKTLTELPLIAPDKISARDYPHIEPQDMPGAMGRGKDKRGRELVAFKLRIKVPYEIFKNECESKFLSCFKPDEHNNVNEDRVLILFQRDRNNPNRWTTSFPGFSVFFCPFFTSVFDPNKGCCTHDQEAYERLKTFIATRRLEYEGHVFELIS